MWLGFERPTNGTVSVLGFDPRSQHGRILRDVGFLPQQPALYERLRVDEHLALAAHYRPAFDIVATMRRLAALGIRASQRASELSGGQQTELALALATGAGPRALLLDEPLASLDPLARRGFLRSLLEAVAGRDCTVVLSSHLVTDLADVCDYLLLIVAGGVRLHDSLQRTLSSHFTVDGAGSPRLPGYVGSFVGLDGHAQSVCQGAEEAYRSLPGFRHATLDEIIMAWLAAPPLDRHT
jgi:ABC-2 type transport system ATP-binding protein